MKTALRFLSILLVLALAGCGSGVTLLPVSGTVTIDDKPVAGAAVLFQPAGGGPAAHAVTDADGRYTLETANSKGAVPGEHKVTVTKKIIKGIREDETVEPSGLITEWVVPEKVLHSRQVRPESHGRARHDRLPAGTAVEVRQERVADAQRMGAAVGDTIVLIIPPLCAARFLCCHGSVDGLAKHHPRQPLSVAEGHRKGSAVQRGSQAFAPMLIAVAFVWAVCMFLALPALSAPRHGPIRQPIVFQIATTIITGIALLGLALSVSGWRHLLVAPLWIILLFLQYVAWIWPNKPWG